MKRHNQENDEFEFHVLKKIIPGTVREVNSRGETGNRESGYTSIAKVKRHSGSMGQDGVGERVKRCPESQRYLGIKAD